MRTLASLLLCVACSSPPPPIRPTPNGGSGGSSAGNAAAGQAGTIAGASGTGSGAGTAGTSGGGASAVSGGTGGSGGTSAPSAWPDGAVAAVSLTYDDGLDSQLAVAAPVLDAHGLRGSFFLSNFEGVLHDWALPNLTAPLNARHAAWQAVAGAGHELASHTVNHPCNDPGKAPGYHLTDYDMTRMSAELDDSMARLARLGAVAPLTFAYPCSSDEQGLGPNGDDYSALVAARFIAARVSTNGIAAPGSLDLMRVSQRDAGGKSADELRAMVDEAIAQGGWLVLLFHGIGEETSCNGLAYDPQACTINYLVTSSAAHESLAGYLEEKSGQVWTATFKQVAQAIASQR